MSETYTIHARICSTHEIPAVESQQSSVRYGDTMVCRAMVAVWFYVFFFVLFFLTGLRIQLSSVKCTKTTMAPGGAQAASGIAVLVPNNLVSVVACLVCEMDKKYK